MVRPSLPVGVLADDLTGALASAAVLREAGLRPVVQWRQQAPPVGATALVVDMRTRDYGSDPGRRAESWAAHLRSLRCRRIELRVDSTLRGSPAAELAGALAGAALDDPWVLAVPAFPAAGRTVVDGLLQAPDLDPPVLDRRVAPLLFADAGSAGLIGTATVDAGAAAVLDAMRTAGTRRFIADASSDVHLRTLAEAADRLAAQDGCDLLTVSPGAWLRYHRPVQPTPYVLVVLSSNTTTNVEQLAELRRSHATTVLHAWALLGGQASPDWEAVRTGGHVLVVETVSRPAGDAAEAWLLSTLAARAAGYLVDDGAHQNMVCAGIVVGGGQTGSALMDVLGAGHLLADGEVAPLCPRATVGDGDWAGLPIITKGGLVGDRGTLTALVDTLRAS